MRIGLAALALSTAAVTGCDGSAEAPPAPAETVAEGPRPGEAALPVGGLPPFGEREVLRKRTQSWTQQLVPDDTAECSFAERPAEERPTGWVVAAWSGNMDLYTDGYVLGQDLSARFVEALWMKNRPVVAARQGMNDLWIEPLGDWGQVLLAIDEGQLTCRRLPSPG